MSDSATVKIFLVQGSPTALRTAEISNWTGKAVAGPRSEIETILKRAEAEKPGVYFLTGINPETGKPKVYIGEAEVIRNRFKSKDHFAKDFWKTILFFVSKDENLTKAHIRYLEGKLIDEAKSVGRFEIDQNASGAHLPESDAADMNIFLSRIEQLLPVLGQDFLKPLPRTDSKIPKSAQLFCVIKKLQAIGRQTEGGFVVFAKSEAVLNERPSTKNYPYASQLRQQLIQEQVLEDDGGKLKFTKNYKFTSPSAAASVIRGGPSNGLTAWKDSEGISLKEKEAKEVSE